jgi:hypothetical protein
MSKVLVKVLKMKVLTPYLPINLNLLPHNKNAYLSKGKIDVPIIAGCRCKTRNPHLTTS